MFLEADEIIHSEFPPVAVQDRPFHETLTEAIWRHSIEQPTQSTLVSFFSQINFYKCYILHRSMGKTHRIKSHFPLTMT